MIEFWIGVLVLVLFALTVVCLPWYRSRHQSVSGEVREQLSKTFYQERLAELTLEVDQGLASDEQALVTELKQSLLDDIPAASSGNQTVLPLSEKRLVLLASIVMLGLCGAMYAWVGGYQQVSHWQQVQHSSEQLTEKLITSQGALSTSDMQDLILALRTRLAQNPNDATGWTMLGRVATAAQASAIAIPAFGKAHELAKQDANITLAYGQSLILTSDEGLQQQGRDLLLPLLEMPSVAFQAQSLLAYDAFSQQKYGDAISYWQKMQSAIPANDQRYAMLADSIAKARQLQGDNMSHGVAVSIAIDKSIVIPKNAILIVSVQDSSGQGMPVAAARFSTQPFPHHVVLTDQNNLTPQRRLSDLKQLVVKARIDLDGNVSTQNGDWIGVSGPVTLGDPVEVLIHSH